MLKALMKPPRGSRRPPPPPAPPMPRPDAAESGDAADAIKREVAKQVSEALASELASLRSRVAALEAALPPSGAAAGRRPPRAGAPARGGYEALGAEERDLQVSCQSKPLWHMPGGDEEVLCVNASESKVGFCQEASPELECDPPESLLNYCMWRLRESPQPLGEPAFRLLALLLVLQQVLMVAFVSVNEVHLMERHWPPPKTRSAPIDACVFEANSIWSLSSIFVATSAAATLLVALVIKQEDTDLMSASFPQAQPSFAAARVLDVVWFLQAVYMPGCFAVEAVTMFANSVDSLEVVMNTLAVTFIMDVDNMLYNSILNHEDKALYQEQKLRRSQEEVLRLNACATAMFVLGFVVMMLHFFHLSQIGHLHGESYVNHWQQSCLTSYLPLYGARAAILLRFHRRSLADGPLRTLFRGFGTFLVNAVAGVAWYALTTYAASFGSIADNFKRCVEL